MVYGEHGEFFFHYTTRRAAFEHILPSRQLRMSPYRKMSDPLESKDWNLGLSYIHDVDIEPDEDYLARVMQIAESTKDHSKLISLTVDADGYDEPIEMFGRGYARASMWELYAERHSGVCLVFDKERFTQAFLEQMHPLGLVERGEVTYTKGGLAEDVHASTLMPENVTEVQSAAEVAARHIVEHSKALFFTKLSDWQGEHEYRFTLWAPDVPEAYFSFGDCLRGVIMGERFPSWQIAGARDVVKRGSADLLQMSWSQRRPLVFDRSV